jgi:hypothetical protein
VIIVADSAPLHYLVLLDLQDLLPQLYGDVLVPTAVVSELSSAGAPKKVREGSVLFQLGCRLNRYRPSIRRWSRTSLILESVRRSH